MLLLNCLKMDLRDIKAHSLTHISTHRLENTLSRNDFTKYTGVNLHQVELRGIIYFSLVLCYSG